MSTEWPADVPRLSPSIAWVLLQRSAHHAWWAHKQLGAKDLEEPTPAMDMGTLAHQLILGGDKVAICDYPDWRTKAAREERDALRAQGRTPVLSHQVEEAEAVVHAVADVLAGYKVNLGLCRREERIEWEQDGCPCSGTPDAWHEALVIDLKTMDRLPSSRTLARLACAGSWPIQRAAYLDGLARIDPEGAGRRRWIWVVAETAPPYAATVVTCDAVIQELGRKQWERARREWVALLKSEDGWSKPWPFADRLELEAPGYVLKQLEEEETT